MDMARRISASIVEGLFVHGLAQRLTPECRERLRAAGLDLGRRLEPSYALEDWKAWLRVLAEEVYPGLPSADAHWKLGEHFAQGWFQTFLGRSVRGLAETVGPRETLARLGRHLRGGNTFSEVWMVERAPNRFELWVNDALSGEPTFMAGVIASFQAAAGARGAKVVVDSFDGTAATYRVTWAEPQRAAS